MRVKQMDKLIKHFDTYFEQSDCTVLHPIVDNGFHIDVLVYKPTVEYPFWKLVTMGASDYKMLKIPPEIYTPLFAISRTAGWCAHRIEEIISGGKIIRPAYKSLCRNSREYIPMDER